MTGPATRLRILCLHGFTSNSAVHAFQLRRLITSLQTASPTTTTTTTTDPSPQPNYEYDFLFPSGPHLVPTSSPSMDMSSAATQTWHDFVMLLNPDSAATGHRAWWYARDADWKTKRQGQFEGLEESFQFLGEFLREQDGPIDAVWGFSQGACLAGMLCALLQPSQAAHPLRKLLPPGQGSVSCGVIFSGFKARFEVYDDIYDKGIEVPVLHVIGEKDPLVDSERSVALMRVCKEEEVLRFEGGHEIPKRDDDVGRIVEFVRKWCEGKGEGERWGTDGRGRVQASM